MTSLFITIAAVHYCLAIPLILHSRRYLPSDFTTTSSGLSWGKYPFLYILVNVVLTLLPVVVYFTGNLSDFTTTLSGQSWVMYFTGFTHSFKPTPTCVPYHAIPHSFNSMHALDSSPQWCVSIPNTGSTPVDAVLDAMTPQRMNTTSLSNAPTLQNYGPSAFQPFWNTQNSSARTWLKSTYCLVK